MQLLIAGARQHLAVSTLERGVVAELLRNSTLIRTGMAALAVAATSTLAACASSDGSDIPSGGFYEVRGKTIMELQEAMESGATTSVEITLSYLERIAAFDQIGPQLNAMVQGLLNDRRLGRTAGEGTLFTAA